MPGVGCAPEKKTGYGHSLAGYTLTNVASNRGKELDQDVERMRQMHRNAFR
jgi:hypothetical protein